MRYFTILALILFPLSTFAAPKKKVSPAEHMILQSQLDEINALFKEKSNADLIDYSGNTEDVLFALAEIHHLEHAKRYYRKRGFTGESARFRPIQSPATANASAQVNATPAREADHKTSTAINNSHGNATTGQLPSPVPSQIQTTGVSAHANACATMSNVNQTKACGNCGKQATKMNQCAKCNSVFYCDRQCQRAHWTFHKPNCGTKNSTESDVKNTAASSHQEMLAGLPPIKPIDINDLASQIIFEEPKLCRQLLQRLHVRALSLASLTPEHVSHKGPILERLMDCSFVGDKASLIAEYADPMPPVLDRLLIDTVAPFEDYLNKKLYFLDGLVTTLIELHRQELESYTAYSRRIRWPHNQEVHKIWEREGYEYLPQMFSRDRMVCKTCGVVVWELIGFGEILLNHPNSTCFKDPADYHDFDKHPEAERKRLKSQSIVNKEYGTDLPTIISPDFPNKVLRHLHFHANALIKSLNIDLTQDNSRLVASIQDQQFRTLIYTALIWSKIHSAASQMAGAWSHLAHYSVFGEEQYTQAVNNGTFPVNRQVNRSTRE